MQVYAWICTAAHRRAPPRTAASAAKLICTLAALRDHLVAFRPERSDDNVIWVPDWATFKFDVEKP